MDIFAPYTPSNGWSATPPSVGTFTPSYASTGGQRKKSTSAVPAPSVEDPAEPKKRGRKGHRKSRAGCFNCKRLKIKCKENRPDCDYCAHRGLKCEWPEIHIKRDHQIETLMRKPTPTATEPMPYVFQSHSPLFTMQDFRLFNHFIQHAYPHHPVGNDSVWKHEIPCLASNYEYLLHSMLALAASDLANTETCPHKMRNTALAHRVKSITALNAAIQRGVNCLEEGNAMLATCFSLLFQSTLIDDGLVEYMTFIRGTTVVGFQMGFKHMRFLFDQFLDDKQLDQSEAVINDAPMIQRDVVFGACRSFEKFQHLCQTKLETQVYAVLLDIARSLVTGSGDAYLKLRQVYVLFSSTMSHDDFRYYCDPNNEVCKILHAHFVALQLIMNPIAKKEQARKAAKCPVEEDKRAATSGWLAALHRDIPRHLLKYYVWTMWIEREVGGGRILDGSKGENHCQFEEVF